MENAEGRVQSTGFFQTQNPRYLAFQLNLDIVFLGAYLKRANGIKQTNKRTPFLPHTQANPMSALFPMQGCKNCSRRC